MKIIIYSTPTCPYCQIAKQYFADNKFKYEEIDISKDQDKAEEMQEKSGQLAVPVIVIQKEDGKEEVVTGFDKDKIDQILNIRQ